MIDLHCHSVFSDGALRPALLIDKALRRGLRCLSLTDHDTVAGYTELMQAALGKAIHIVNGIEFSTRWKKHDIHILGYQLQHNDALYQHIEQQNTSRIERAKQIATLLEKVGLVGAYEKACVIAGHQRVGRPHFAQLLVDEGIVRDMPAAFKQILGRGKPAYVPTAWMSVQEAVEGIRACGGQAVIAHPLKYGLTQSKLHALINDFKEAGGVGIEVVAGEMTVTQVQAMAGTSVRFKLLASSGTDFHADLISRLPLGGQLPLPDMCTPIWHDWNIQ